MTLREDIAAEPDPKRRARLKAEHLRDLWAAEWVTDLTITRRVGARDWSIIFDERPKVIRDRQNRIIGIDATVRVLRDGAEMRIDPHRICINPPILVPDGTTHTATDPITGQQYEVDNFVLNPREAYLRWLADSIRDTPNPSGWRTRGTVTTIFATAPGGNGNVQSDNATYATARTGGTLSVTDSHAVGQQVGFWCREAFAIFDTSSLTDTDSIDAVVASFKGVLDGSTTDFNVVVAASSYDGGAVVTGDWVSGASLPTPSLATWNSSGYLAAYNAFTSTGSFPAAINKTGNTSLILYSDRHAAGTTPTAAEYVFFNDADSGGTTNDPKLDITHTAADSAALTGTVTASITEVDIVAGGKTIILTLSGDTWIAAGAASFDLQRQAIINGIDSAQSETFGWDLVPKALQSVAGVIRTSDTIVTITLDAFATYNITAPETVTATIPAAALTGGIAIVATPMFTIGVEAASTRPLVVRQAVQRAAVR